MLVLEQGGYREGEAVLDSSWKHFTVLLVVALENTFLQTYSTEITNIHIQYSTMGLGDQQQVFGIQELYRPDHEPADIE